ncbi:MAG: exonuclease V subunit alpha [Methanomassiliicoccales archaeon PtaU1.Bin124]|nr:MAG: exonuclease V subunit alpha [Methanomassiliicoccales archaeon PtaU1.Bin124]
MDGTPHIFVNDIGEFIQRDSCLRRFKLGLNEKEVAMDLPFFPTLRASLDPVLQESGRKREDEWAEMLRTQGFMELKAASGADQMTWSELCQALSMLPTGQKAFAREVEIDGPVGVFHLHGRMDFVVLHWDGTAARMRIVECKASRKDRTYHRMQLAAYSVLIRQKLRDGGTSLSMIPVLEAGLEEVVARLSEEGKGQDPMSLRPLDLSTEREDLAHMLCQGGLLHTAYSTTKLDLLPYQLSAKCDGCVFCPHCLPESARQRRLELLGLDVSMLTALRAAGIEDIDGLADLDPFSDRARQVHHAPGFNGSVEVLIARAKARRATLPQAPEGEHPIISLPYSGRGQLPAHGSDAGRLVRVYLAIEHDYLEDRVVAAAAHITTSEGRLRTPFMKNPDGKWRVAPRIEEEKDQLVSKVQGFDVVRMREAAWTGDPAKDDDLERALLSEMFSEIVSSIRRLVATNAAPVHFYVWSRKEMDTLVDACERVQGGLLHHLTELLGCRQPTEQLIFTPLQEEIAGRYAMGWTSNSLIAATSLKWYGRSFHWTRELKGKEVALDRVFEQDIFDFRTGLYMNADGSWSGKEGEGVRFQFEIRTRHHDEIRAPYWHALWGILPEVQGKPVPNLRRAMFRFRQAADPDLFRLFLTSRCHALRWAEERVQFRNEQISKPSLDLEHLASFRLERDSVRQASIDFLRLDHHIKRGEWLSGMLQPPLDRCSSGRSVPVRKVEHMGDGLLRAELDLDRMGIDPAIFQEGADLGEDSFVRLTPCSPDPREGQSLKQILSDGLTAHVQRMDVKRGIVEMSVIPTYRSNRYKLLSVSPKEEGIVFDFATIDESGSDYPSSNVEDRLEKVPDHPCYQWFEPERPDIPPREIDFGRYAELVERLKLNGHALNPEQRRACLDGLRTRVQLLLGPPGTGKTSTTAVAILLRLLAREEPNPLFILGANTHTAADELCHDLESAAEPFSQAVEESTGRKMRPYRVVRIPRDGDSSLASMNDALASGAALMVGTTNQLLKLAREHERTRMLPLSAHALIVDEASMMVFPHFLALTTMLGDDAEIMLSGDHMQLSPIVAHDWGSESRPQSCRYEPFRSCYEVAWDLAMHPSISPTMVRRSALQHTYRLGPEVRELVSPIYAAEGVVLKGRGHGDDESGSAEGLAAIWSRPGLYLLLHDEEGSKKCNEFEASLVHDVIAVGPRDTKSVAVITPHRAQRALLRTKLEDAEEVVAMIDTVERLQGGECDTVIVSGTQSDPNAIAASADFILDLNRSNVIFSRAKKRLVVVCSRNLLNSVPADLENYRSAYLWKRVRSMCTERMMTLPIDEHAVELRRPRSAQ